MKYLGLLAMSKILRTHPKSVQAHKDLVLQCLDDKDESIRLRALDLLYGMVRACPAAHIAPLLAWPLPHCRCPPGVQKEPDGDRQEADDPRGQGRGHDLP